MTGLLPQGPAASGGPRGRQRSDGFLFQSLHTVATKGFVLLSTFAFGVITAQYLGPAGKGAVTLLSVLPTLALTFGELGLRQSTALLIAKKRFDERDVQASMLALYLLVAAGSFVVVLVGYGTMGLYSYGIVTCGLFAALAPVGLFQRFANGILLGHRKILAINWVEALRSGGNLAVVAVLVIGLGLGVGGAGAALLTGPFLAALVLAGSIWRYAVHRPRWVSPIPGELLRLGLFFAASQLLLMLNYRIDYLMLGRLQDASTVGIYSVGVGIAELLWQIPLSMGLVLFARSLGWSAEDAREKIAHVYRVLRLILPCVLFGAAALIVGSWYLLVPIYGAPFRASFPVLVCLIPGTVPLTLFLFLHVFAAGQGRPHLSLHGFLPGLVVNVGLNLVMIPRLGAVGAALSSTLSYALSVALYLRVFLREFDGSLREVFLLRGDDLAALWGILRRRPRGASR